jgi:hypothetical protein
MHLYDTVFVVKGNRISIKHGEKIRSQSEKQRSRGRYLKKPPEFLGELIVIVNCLPSDELKLRFLHPDSLRGTLQPEEEASGSEPEGATLSERLDVLAIRSTVGMCPELRNYVGCGEFGTVKFEPVTISMPLPALFGSKPLNLKFPKLAPNAFQRYAEVWDAHEILHGIARVANSPGQGWRLWRMGRSAALPLRITIDAQGFVRERKSLISRAFEGTDIEAVRIRECPICKQIYWAGRIDAQHCGDGKCKSVLSSRLYRNPKLRDLYNAARKKKRRKLRAAKG